MSNCKYNFRVVESSSFPDCCFVCKFGRMSCDWEISCPFNTSLNYSKVWTVCDMFERQDKSVFEKQNDYRLYGE